MKKCIFAWNAARRAVRFAVARFNYQRAGNTPSHRFAHPRDIGVLLIDPNHNTSGLALPANYVDLVDHIERGVTRKLGIARECVYTIIDDVARFRLDKGEDLPERTWDVPEFVAGDVQMVRTKTCDDIPAIEELCQTVMPEIEKQIYGSYVEVASSFGEMKFATRHTADKDGRFHSDRHYEDTLRLIIYLSDVDDTSGPFEYLVHKDTHKTLRIPVAEHPTRTANGRIPEADLNRYLSEGYERVRVTGKKGTALLFDSKIIHRANPAKIGSRTVAVLPIRPALRKPTHYIDPAHQEAVYV